uniref:UDP-glucuronate decarboxylase 1 n=1 Tax=Lates calcarifer TaxID=8187 RepID=A0A4W6FH47_LATCA
MMKRVIWLLSGLNRRMMKLLFALALIAYIASVWGTFTNMRSIQEHAEMNIEQRIDEAVAPLREKIRDLEQSFSQKYPPVKFLSEKDRKRILITGGAGFVGSHLTDKLMMDGHEVTVVDNFFTGRKRNVEHWIGHENFELINHDVVEPLYIEDQICAKGACFESVSEVKKRTTEVPRQLSEEYLLHCFDQWKTRMQQCVAAEEEEDYAEGERH